MTISPLGLGAGSRLDGTGLRQIADNIAVPTLLQLKQFTKVVFYSPSGEVIYTLYTGLGEGGKLNIIWKELKIGGLIDFSITMFKNTEVPFFTGMLVKVFIFNTLFFAGEVTNFPPTDTEEETISVIGTGFINKLKKTTINKTYIDQTPKEIIEDLSSFFTEQNINYNRVKLQLPNFNISKITFNDKNVLEAINTLKNIVNYQYSEFQFVYGVDEFQDFYFVGLDKNNVVTNLFEGFNYQNPKTNTENDRLVNQVNVYRAKEASQKETELVNTYFDDNSIENNGLYEEKLTISDFIDNDTAEKIALAIIEAKKDPKKIVAIKNLITTKRFNWGYYGISNKKRLQKFLVSEFNDLTIWDKTLYTSTLSIRTENVFSGRKCFQWNIDNSLGDKISYNFNKIFSPQKMIFYVRHSVALKSIQVSFSGIKKEVRSQVITSENDLVVTNDDKTIIAVTKPAYTKTTEVSGLFFNDWLAVEVDLTEFSYIDNVEFEVITVGTNVILLDSMTCYANSYFSNKLTLEEISYNVSDSSLIASAVFGERIKDIITELKEINKESLTSYNMFAKQ